MLNITNTFDSSFSRWTIWLRIMHQLVCVLSVTNTKLCFKVHIVLNITNTFDSSFSRWTIWLGIMHQLSKRVVNNNIRVNCALSCRLC